MKLPSAIISGGGIGGLAAALAALRAGWSVQLFEKAAAFSEVGAGIQLGPNVVKVLQGWGLGGALQSVAAFPEQLLVKSAVSGALLGRLPLGVDIAARYGAAYATVHRADLHELLMAAAVQQGVMLHTAAPLQSYVDGLDVVRVKVTDGREVAGDALIGADGLWSRVRQQMLGDGLPRPTGHLAYRALVPQALLAQRHRSQNVTAWLGPRMHAVHYPVRRGELLNIVVFVHGDLAADEIAGWDHSANHAELASALRGTPAALRELVDAIPEWRLWPMRDRLPMDGTHQQAAGRVALLGDAAHPMRPYLAQGAGMAIEDAAELGRAMADLAPGSSFANATRLDVASALQRYAQARWQRNARVQARALRNGEIFHADGALRMARDASMKLLGERLLDMPWLYGGGPGAASAAPAAPVASGPRETLDTP